MNLQKKKNSDIKIKKDELIAAFIIFGLYCLAQIISHTPLVDNTIISFIIVLFLKNSLNVFIITILLLVMYYLKKKITINKMKSLFKEDQEHENS